MKIISAIRLAVRIHYIDPIIGRLLNRSLQWLRTQDGWDHVVLIAAHTLIETQTAIVVRTRLAEVIKDVGRYLSPESLEVLQHIDEIAKKHSPEAN